MEVKSKMYPDNSRFYKQVTSKLGGETLTSCYQCGTCASSCPVAKLTKRFNPRNIIKNILLGKREKLLTDGSIWLCCSCFNCQERCPQEVEIGELIFTLRNMALAEGYAPKAFVDMAASLMSKGRVVPVTKFLMRRREKAGLPPISDTGIEALNKIFSIPSSKVDEEEVQ